MPVDARDLLARLTAGRHTTSDGAGPVTHIRHLPARAGQTEPWPDWVPEALRKSLAEQGITAPWRHQTEAAQLVHDGHSTVIATGTASGKSLAYQLPVLTGLLAEPRATALYLSPTKALAADQLRSLDGLLTGDLTSLTAAGYDGDTPQAERDWVRAHARLVLTNPDMLHQGMLPGHRRWATFLRRLRYVVIDECHTYRGVFGSHVAQVLRRLRRLAAHYGADEPVFVLASATVAEPATAAGRLTGGPVRAVTEDFSPRAARTVALWEPPLLPPEAAAGEHGAPVRVSALTESATLLADLVACGVRTMAFVRSRRGAELVAAIGRRALAEAVPELADRIAAYRAGYLAEERRELERAVRSGELLGIAATTALELGVDLVGLDAVVLAGYPGTLASLWQQAGRAGRSGVDEALCVLVGRDDPLDTYLLHHPEAIFDRPVEQTVLDPANPYVLGPHLCCAAAELPLSVADLDLFGGEIARSTVASLAAARSLRERPTGWYWTQRGRPQLNLRGGSGEPVSVVRAGTGRLLGTVDADAAHSQVHAGAVYLHQGVSFVVDELDLDDGVALVHPETPDWTTHAREQTDLTVVGTVRSVPAGPVTLQLGVVDVTSQVVSYQRRRSPNGEFIDERPLDLPPRQLRTVAVWYTIDPAALERSGLAEADLPGSLHAAEHAAIGLLPLTATCDRWDIGGLSTALHPDTGLPTVFVYDGHPGGAGFAERGFGAAVRWLTATRDAIRACGCEAGCPSCVQSPKCGNGNDPLDKSGALRVLDLVLDALPDDPDR
ncbi:DEAD/DEAH box helicase [Actinocatenispora comari]|uniref:DEAD/DEAH box helicase n=1 Tax=Actinocatenispora comari TaxID=2807577 RepID=UPI00351A493F